MAQPLKTPPVRLCNIVLQTSVTQRHSARYCLPVYSLASTHAANNLCRILGFLESAFSQIGVVPPAKLIVGVPCALAVPQHRQSKRRHDSHTTDTAPQPKKNNFPATTL